MILTKQIEWQGANTREDGTPYLPSDRQGYLVSIRPATEVASSPDDFVVFASTEADAENFYVMPVGLLAAPLSEGTWLVAVQDLDKSGHASAWSADLYFDVVVTNPKAPTGLVVS